MKPIVFETWINGVGYKFWIAKHTETFQVSAWIGNKYITSVFEEYEEQAILKLVKILEK